MAASLETRISKLEALLGEALAECTCNGSGIRVVWEGKALSDQPDCPKHGPPLEVTLIDPTVRPDCPKHGPPETIVAGWQRGDGTCPKHGEVLDVKVKRYGNSGAALKPGEPHETMPLETIKPARDVEAF